jgi:hypothetical protein
MEIEYLQTNGMLADIFTKSLPNEKFKLFSFQLLNKVLINTE